MIANRFLQVIARKSASQTLWTPANITTTAWYDADDSDTITSSGGFVSQWDDKSGNGTHMTQGTGSRQPTIGTDTINSKPTITFDGISQYINAAFSPNYTGTTVSAFMVAQRNSVVAQTGYLILYAGSGSDWNNNQNALMFHVPATSTIIRGFRNNTVLSSHTHPSTNTPFLVNGAFDGSNHTQWLNGTAATPVAQTASFSYNTFVLGCRFASGSPSNFVDADIGEVVIIHGTVSTDTRQKMEGYLAHKWGLTANLPSGHPYKTNPPYA